MNISALSTLTAQFHQAFRQAPKVMARAPGRIEFIGNHTDYNGGAVLGAAINRYVWVAAAPNDAGHFRLHTDGATRPIDFAVLPAGRLGGPEAWTNYPLGVWRSLGDFKMAQPAGFDLLVMSDLPAGAGLSSSAALELATALVLLELTGSAALAPAQLAALGRHAENNYVGVPCGILDQGTSAFGRTGHLVHIDCRGPHFARVPLPAGAQLWIFNTREKHALIDGLYAARHRECLDAAQAMGVSLLADLSPEQFRDREWGLVPLLAKRAKHIVEEHARVGEMIGVLQRGDLPAAGRLLTASHRSSQLLFENSTPTLDRLVDILEQHPAVYGARLTGGGFGGAVMALTRSNFTATEAEAVAGQILPRAETLQLESADGACLIG